MRDLGSLALTLAGALNVIASVAHLACIMLGAPAYRFMGAGERMACAAEAGKARPTLITLSIASVLLTWAAYAFSAAGLAPPLPFTGPAILAIGSVYLARAFCFPLLRPRFPENSTTFWIASSLICLVIGTLYILGFAVAQAH